MRSLPSFARLSQNSLIVPQHRLLSASHLYCCDLGAGDERLGLLGVVEKPLLFSFAYSFAGELPAFFFVFV
jgi:hypothetical protein